jgi:methylmalonyl-CoA/ethylmalonyl-CoA epimerase
MLYKIEHIGIAVINLELAIPLYTQLLGSECYKREIVETEGVETAFFKMGDSKIELLQSLNPSGVIARFIEKKGEGLHHIAYAVENIQKEMERMRLQGFQLLQEEPKMGADGKWVCFLHPKSTGGSLVELCQDRDP